MRGQTRTNCDFNNKLEGKGLKWSGSVFSKKKTEMEWEGAAYMGRTCGPYNGPARLESGRRIESPWVMGRADCSSIKLDRPHVP